MTRRRSAGIVIHENQILLMFRKKEGRVYYTFPGGGIEAEETPEQAVQREILEETMLRVGVGPLVYEFDRSDIAMHEYFYRCAYQGGAAILPDTAEEHQRQNEQNIFCPEWISLEKLEHIVVLPSEVSQQLLVDLSDGFSDIPISITGMSTNKHEGQRN